jgi:hypothetical protein
MMRAASMGLLAAACFLVACGAREVLIPRSGANPAAIDFSGMWRLRTDDDADQRRLDEAIRRTDGVDSSEILRSSELEQYGRGPYRPRRDPGGLVHVFLQNGAELKITQTAGALFISFDRAVVQEFRFGEHRQVQVGPVVADRVSGWEGAEYVVETLDESGMKLTERLAFGADRNTLRRTIILRGRNMEAETVVQTFDRVS